MSEAIHSAADRQSGQLSPCIAGNFTIRGPAGVLEGLVGCPEDAKAVPLIGIVCHPHSLHGGTMHNKVVHMLARSLEQLGLRTVRFNFRGVGGSGGRYDGGYGETEDLLAVLDWVRDCCPDSAVWLAGFSFGSYVALRAASLRTASQVVLVAPPVNHYDFAGMSMPNCHCLVIQGEEDEVVPAGAVRDWAAQLGSAPQLVMVPGATHFFHGRLNDLRTIVVELLAPRLPSKSSGDL